ncbi:hypothetical protein MP228_007682 [Amoeboaphelidium protococcarum]|nr:hypothetical protein MP228_007682 [Amoeboaphelidium protococcarum]
MVLIHLITNNPRQALLTWGLLPHWLHQELSLINMDSVARCTDIHCEDSRFLNGYVIWVSEQDREIPDLRFGQGLMRQFFQAVLAIYSNRLHT